MLNDIVFLAIHRENQGKQKESHEVQLLPCYADREANDQSQPILEAFDNSEIVQLDVCHSTHTT